MCIVSDELSISVIIPVHNGSTYLGPCLDALLRATAPCECEILVVDDGSTDDSRLQALKRRVRVLQLAVRGGPSAARNRGAEAAKGSVLLFIDADVLVPPRLLTRVWAHFTADPKLSAVFGSYDDDPADDHLCSQYKNLLHHYMHQQARPQAETFWSGCGAVRRELFLRLGGFNEELWAVEDVELGYRLSAEGHSVLLDKELQVKHLKRWTLKSMLYADIFQRALPWSKLMLARGRLTDDLNVRKGERLKAAALLLSLLLLPLSLLHTSWLVPVALLLGGVLVSNRRLYLLFFRRRGVCFALIAALLHLLYYGYSSTAFALCYVSHVWKKSRGTPLAGETDVAG